MELGVTWDVDLYGELLKIGGGKERYKVSSSNVHDFGNLFGFIGCEFTERLLN